MNPTHPSPGTIQSLCDPRRTVHITLSAPYPNPTSSLATVNVTVSAGDNVSIHVYDLLGRRVLQVDDGRFSTGAHTLTLDTSSLSPGVYHVRATNGMAHVSRQLVVVR